MEADGLRVLVDRVWPRGLAKKQVRVDVWMKDIAPSTELRRWYGHDPGKWPEFRRRYFAEFQAHTAAVEVLMEYARPGGTVTLLFGASEERLNNAVVLKEYMESAL